MRLRPIRPEDIRALAELNSSVFKDTRPARAAAVFRDCMKRAVPGACVAAVEGGIIAGAVFVSREATFQGQGAHIRSLFVAERFRGKGVGRALLRRAVAAAKKAGCRTVSLSVEPGNSAAIAMYERAGFERTRLRYTKRI